MSFSPINDDHAIRSAKFAVQLSQPVPNSLIEKLSAHHAPWRGDLPATAVTEHQGFIAGPDGKPIMSQFPGVEFSFKRPDGNSVWLLRVAGHSVEVETTRYTRWGPTWERALRFLEGSLRGLLEASEDVPLGVGGVALTVLDVFTTPDAEPSFDDLLNKREFPENLLKRGALWHCHTGWFTKRLNAMILNQLNVDSRQEQKNNVISGDVATSVDVSILHKQGFRINEPLNATINGLYDVVKIVSDEMSFMHGENKKILCNLLSESMGVKIGVVP